MSSLDDAYAGLVLAFTTGPARGRAHRILGTGHRETPASLASWRSRSPTAIRTPRRHPPKLAAEPSRAATRSSQRLRLVINGRPFNGTGVGYEPRRRPRTARSSPPASRRQVPNRGKIKRLLAQLRRRDRLLALMPNGTFFNAAATSLRPDLYAVQSNPIRRHSGPPSSPTPPPLLLRRHPRPIGRDRPAAAAPTNPTTPPTSKTWPSA